MNWIDFAILGVILLSTLISLVRGFVKEAISLGVWIVAFFIASQFYADLAVYFTKLEDPIIRQGAAVVALFIATLILGSLVNYVVSKLVEHTGLSGTDRMLGAVFGLLRGALVVSAILFCLDVFTPAPTTQWWQASVLIPEFRVIVEWFFEYLQTNSSFLKPV